MPRWLVVDVAISASFRPARSGTLAAQPSLMSTTLEMTHLARIVTDLGKQDVGSIVWTR